MFTRIIASFALSLLSFPVLSEAATPANWTSVGESDEGVIFVDLTRISKNGELRRSWTLKNYSQQQKVTGGRFFRSIVLQEEFDCVNGMSRTLAYHVYSGLSGDGDVVFSSTEPEKDFMASPPNTGGDRVLRATCGAKVKAD